MKIFLLTCLLSLFSLNGYSQETPSSNIIIDIDQQEENTKNIGIADFASSVSEVAIYFHTNYPDDKIETDLKPDIAKFFPNLTQQELYDREEFIRKSIKIYRWGKNKYKEIKDKILVPDTPMLTYKDEDYETYEKKPYIDAGEDNTIIQTDIKKVISYSPNLKERENHQEFVKRKENISKLKEAFPGIVKLKQIYDKIEIKKLPFYGLLYEDPKTKGEGIGPWSRDTNISVRLATTESHIPSNNQIKGIVHFNIFNQHIILSQNYHQFSALNIDFSNSKNLKSCNSFNPFPQRFSFADGDLIGYNQTLGYPFICDVIDNQQDAQISANITYSICSPNKKCQIKQLPLSLNLHSGDGFNTMMLNFITQSFNHLPNTEEKNIQIQDVSIKDNPQSPSGETLRIIINTNDNINKPEFIVETSSNTEFSTPRITVDGKQISAFLDIISTNHQLLNTDVKLCITTDNIRGYLFNKTIHSSSIFDINNKKLTLGLILLAILGGFILNFMPCVFPVLSLKILSLTQFGAKNHQNLKTSFLLSILGIFSSFLVLAGTLSILKLIGYNLGWGMQFQNPIFITTMIFAILLFIAQIQGLINLNFLPLNKIQKHKLSPHWNSFWSGILVVLMATPCTGPYLGTTIGFALSGTTFDIFTILSAIALGLSLPYILLLLSPNLSAFIPSPGPWMHKLHIFMNTMLILTFIWLISILYAQSSWLTITGTTICALLFYTILFIYRKSLTETEILSGKNKQLLQQSHKFLHTVFITILSIIFIISLGINYHGFTQHKNITKTQTTTQIDFNQIADLVQKGNNVLVKIGADWCLTCSYNDLLVFDNISSEDLFKTHNIKVINIDWTEYDPEILNFMSEYGRRGLPFYILYNRHIPEGIVLPEILSRMEFERILNNSGNSNPIEESK